MCVMLFSNGFRTIAPVPGGGASSGRSQTALRTSSSRPSENKARSVPGLMTERARHGYCSRGRGTPRRKHSKTTLRLSLLDRPLAQREGGNEEAPPSRPAFRIDGSLL